MLIIPILHPNYSLPLNFINNSRISTETRVLQNEKTEINTPNPFWRLLSLPGKALGRWALALTVTHSHSSGGHQLLGMTSGQWSRPDGKEKPVRSLKFLSQHRMSWGTEDTRMEQTHLWWEENYTTNLPGKPKSELSCPPWSKAPEHTVIQSWGCTGPVPSFTEIPADDLRYLIFTHLSQPIFKPSYLQAGYWYKTH